MLALGGRAAVASQIATLVWIRGIVVAVRPALVETLAGLLISGKKFGVTLNAGIAGGQFKATQSKCATLIRERLMAQRHAAGSLDQQRWLTPGHCWRPISLPAGAP